jgi:hypothetical protein
MTSSRVLLPVVLTRSKFVKSTGWTPAPVIVAAIVSVIVLAPLPS